MISPHSSSSTPLPFRVHFISPHLPCSPECNAGDFDFVIVETAPKAKCETFTGKRASTPATTFSVVVSTDSASCNSKRKLSTGKTSCYYAMLIYIPVGAIAGIAVGGAALILIVVIIIVILVGRQRRWAISRVFFRYAIGLYISHCGVHVHSPRSKPWAQRGSGGGVYE